MNEFEMWARALRSAIYEHFYCKVIGYEDDGTPITEEVDGNEIKEVMKDFDCWLRQRKERGHIPPPVDIPYLAVGTVLQPLPHPECEHDWVCGDNEIVSNASVCRKCWKIVPTDTLNTSSSDSRTSSDASPEAAPPPTD